MSHRLHKHKPLKHLLSIPHLYRVHPRPLSLSSHTPPHPSSQLPLSSPSTSTPSPGRHLRTQTDCTLSGPGPAWQLAPPVRLCAHPPSQRIRIASSMGGDGGCCVGFATVPQKFHSASIGRHRDGSPTTGACQLVHPTPTIMPTTIIQQTPRDAINM